MSIIPYIESPFRMMERDFFRSPFNVESQRPLDNMLQKFENVMRPIDQLCRAANLLTLNEIDTKISLDDEKFQVNVDVQHFAPEEISVKVVEGNVIIEGKHEEKRDQHGYVSRQFVRRYALPNGCLPDTVKSTLSSDGVLTVTAPKVLRMPSIGERIVPVTPTGPVKKVLGSPEI